MDVRGKVIIQSIRAEPWSGAGGGTNNSREDLITNCDAYAR